jgi:chromosome segregation ATPase
MRGIPSFDDFDENSDLFENLEESLIMNLREIETDESPYERTNENVFLDEIKNKVSKFLLGPLSGMSMLDEAANIILQLEIEFVKKSNEFEKKINNIEDQIDDAASDKNTEKIKALQIQRDNLIDEHEKYSKAQKLKIEKAVEGARKIASSSKRRKDYLAAKIADNEIEISELEYKLAKQRSEKEESLKKYEKKLAKARERAEEKARELEEAINKSEEEEEKRIKSEEPINVEKEKKIISKRKGGDIIKRKNELEKEIADLKSDMERKLNQILKKITSSQKPPTERYMENSKLDLIEMATSLEFKMELLKTFRDLGRTPGEIEKTLKSDKDLQDAIDKVNKGISGAKTIKSDILKAFKEAFSNIGVGKPGRITPDVINKLKDKLNK